MKKSLLSNTGIILTLGLLLGSCSSSEQMSYGNHNQPYNRTHKPAPIPIAVDTTTHPQFIENVAMENKHVAVVNSKPSHYYRTNTPAPERKRTHTKKTVKPVDEAATASERRTEKRTPQLEKPAVAEQMTAAPMPQPQPVVTPAPEPTKTSPLTKKYADLLGVNEKEITNPILYQFIDEWYGVRYRMGGCDKTGVDCSAFVQKLYEEVFATNVLRTAMEQYSDCSFIRSSSQMQEGDLVFFGIHSKKITHVGVYLMNGFFIHSSTSQGVNISNINDDYWQKHFVGGGRIPKANGHL